MESGGIAKAGPAAAAPTDSTATLEDDVEGKEGDEEEEDEEAGDDDGRSLASAMRTRRKASWAARTGSRSWAVRPVR